MLIARSQWLLRLMVLVMAFTGPLQAFASMVQSDMPVCPAATAQAMDARDHQMNADHCAHMDKSGGAQLSDAHARCGQSCMGNCGACAHCPAGIAQFSTSLETPPQFLSPAVQNHPGDVPPETNLRPPRAFS